MLFTGSRVQLLETLPRDRVVLQISIDSPTPDLHDLHRGKGTWEKAMRGATLAREHGFRVRIAATVASELEDAAVRTLMDRMSVPEEDRVVRRVAMRGFAEEGIALSRADVVPEVTITDGGVYWHPVGAGDDDFLVTRAIFPLRDAIEEVRAGWLLERRHHDTLAAVFHCA
jgi:hypothetical protein